VLFPSFVYARIWKSQVGPRSLYLLDTNIAENSEADKKITAELYVAIPKPEFSRKLF
jgi:starch phosphorylase